MTGAALFGAATVLVTVAGGLLTVPLGRAGATVAFFTVVAVVGAVALLSAGSRLRRPVAWTLPMLIAGFWAWAPFALARTPDPVAGRLELDRLAPCFALALAVLGTTRGRRPGLSGMRLGWFAGLVLSVAIAAWELVTMDHLWITPDRPFSFGDARIAVGTYINPNNFATALVAMIAGSLALAGDLASTAARRGVLVVVALGCLVVLTTRSRSGVLALAIVLALEVRRRVIDHRESTGVGLRERFVGLPQTVRRGAWAVAAAAAVLVVAVFAVPSLAARNPVMRMVAFQFGEETARSDSLRVQLLTVAWRYLRESGWLGTGAGSFEHLLWHDPAPGTIKMTNLHNAFMELVSQYGVPIGVLYALVPSGVVAVLLRSMATPGPAARATRYEATGYLVALVLLGVAASSALHVTTWWVMHAAACACAWQLSARSARSAVGGSREP